MSLATLGIGVNLKTTYAHRQPYGWGGSDGWELWSDTTPSSVATQSIMDARIDAWTGALDFITYPFYPLKSQIVANPNPVSGIMLPYIAHGASTKKGKVKRCLWFQAFWLAYPNLTTDSSWANLTTYAAYVVSEMADPDYQRIDGKSAVYLFNPHDVLSGTANTNWLLFLSLLGQEVYVVGIGSLSTSDWTAARCNAGTAYSGALGATLSPNGAHPWSDQVTRDQSNWGQPGFDLCAEVNASNDHRARSNSENTTWCDRPSAPDFVTAIRAFSIPSLPIKKLIHISPLDELDESGGTVATIQDPGMRNQGVFSELLQHIRGSTILTTYTYKIGADTAYCTATGTWTRTTAISGAYDSTEMRSLTLNDTLALTHVRCTGFTLYGTTGPDRGIMTVQVDGSTVATVDLYAASPTVSALLFTSSTLSTASHTVQVTVTATKNGSSSANTIGIDSVGCTWIP